MAKKNPRELELPLGVPIQPSKPEDDDPYGAEMAWRIRHSQDTQLKKNRQPEPEEAPLEKKAKSETPQFSSLLDHLSPETITKARRLLRTIETGEYISKREMLDLFRGLRDLGIPINPADYRALPSRRMYGFLMQTKNKIYRHSGPAPLPEEYS